MDPWADEGCEEVEPDQFECYPTEQGEALQWLEGAALAALPALGTAIVEPLLSAIADRVLAIDNLDGRLQVDHEVLQVFSSAGEEVIEAVLRLAESEPEPETLEAVVAVIEFTGGERAAEVMIGLLDSEHDWAVELAAQALASLPNAAAVEPLAAALPRLQDHDIAALDAWNGRYPNAAARALVAIGEPALPAVRRALASGDPGALAPAAYVSARLGDREAAAHLLTLIDHDDEAVRDNACLALGAMRYQEALQPLLERARRVKGTDLAFGTLPVILKALEMLRNPGALPLLKELARDEYHFWEAMAAMAEIPDDAVEQALMAALDTDDLRTVAAAYRFYIRRAVAGSEPKLIAALEEYGDADRALDYLNSGNSRLAAAGREWLEANQYLILEVAGEQTLRWGSH
jgi:HEAT repeat protein